MIKTKKGKITNDKITNGDNKFFWKVITKKDLEKIFTDEVCYLSFQEILEILKSNNNKYQENSGEYTEWTEDLINRKLTDLEEVLKSENFVLKKTTDWSIFRGLKENLTSIKDLGTELESFEATTKELKQKLLQAGCIKQGEIEDENPISVFRPLLWDKSALLSKIVFNHHGKKFRTLHHFGLFVPENYTDKDLTLANQNEIFANAFSKMNQFNVNALNDDKLRFLKRDIFENNKIPTLFGHEGKWKPDAQTLKMYCVDTDHGDNLNVVCVVDSNNNVKPYYTYKCIENKNRDQNVGKLKLGDYDGEKIIKLAIYDCKHQDNISIIDKYVESGQQSFETVNAIDAIIRSKDTQKIEDYHRIFAFSQKDKRAQQVYETYKKFTDQGTQIIINDNQNKQSPKMVELKDIHSINTPCGGCF